MKKRLYKADVTCCREIAQGQKCGQEVKGLEYYCEIIQIHGQNKTFGGLTTIDMCMHTWICGFYIWQEKHYLLNILLGS